MDWAAKLFGLADHFLNSSGIGGGVIQVSYLPYSCFPSSHSLHIISQTTASDSALVAIVAARSLYTSKHPDVKLENMIIYTTTQTHSLGVKASLILGLHCRSLEVTAEDQFALRGATLRKALEEDGAKGLHPFILGDPHG